MIEITSLRWHTRSRSASGLGVISLPRARGICAATSVVLPPQQCFRSCTDGAGWSFCLRTDSRFGFASVLRTSACLGALLIASSVSIFGVEVGQLAIVSAFLPLRRASDELVLPAPGLHRRSLAIVAVAGIWLVERAFNMKIISS